MITSSGYRLGITCCFCGGTLEIDEASHNTRCPHCASMLRIARQGGVPRYFIEDTLDKREVKFLIERHLKKTGCPLVSMWRNLTEVYLPFWRVTGTVVSIQDRTKEIKEDFQPDYPQMHEDHSPFEVKIVPRELSFCADQSFNWGLDTLGVRAQVVKLIPLPSDFQHDRNLAPVSAGEDEARSRFERAAASIAHLGLTVEKEVEIAPVGLKFALIYFPIWLASFVSAGVRQLAQFDPVAKRVVALKEGEFEASPVRANTDSMPATIKVVPHRCPNCGMDLPAAAQSVTFYCNNCRRLYLDIGDRFSQLQVMIPEEVNPEHRLFPFWIFDLKSSQWDRQDDLLDRLRLARLSNELFYLPAFAISNPSRLLRLVNHYNRRTPKIAFQRQPTDRYMFVDVSETPEQAGELVAPLVTAAAAMEGNRLSGRSRLRVEKLENVNLVWLPYEIDRYFWREQLTGATIEKAAVGCLG
jgi:predicted RNA-binding Zn-ribbon protein involved in translation (DUF1610 family)